MTKGEIEILKQLKLGNERAYRYLFEKEYVLLCKIAAEFVKDDFIAETIVGDVIVHIWEIRDKIEITTSIRAYLLQAVRNRCLNHLKLEYIRKEVRFSTLSDKDGSIDYLFFEDDTYPLSILLEKELESEILCAVERLPKECNRVFRMSRFNQLKNQEIADQLNISINTVKYHLKNALNQLNNDLSKYLVTTILWFLF